MPDQKICQKGSDHRFEVTSEKILGHGKNKAFPIHPSSTYRRLTVICIYCGKGGVVITKPYSLTSLAKKFKPRIKK